MVATSTVAVSAAVALIKNVLDGLYATSKEAAHRLLAKSRSDLRDQTIAKALIAVTKIKTLWNVEKEVSLYQFYYPAKIAKPGGVARAISSLRELGPARNFVLQGTAGQGKSVFLRYLVGQELKQLGSAGRVPLFVELRRLRADLPLASLILQTLEKLRLPHTLDAWSHLAGTGRFVLLLDAFDEIDPSLVDRAVADIETLCDKHSDRLQIIVTSRPDADIQRSTRFHVLKLSPLESSDHIGFLERICPDREQADNLVKVIGKSSSDIKGLLTTPLMMTLLVILYKSLQTVPDTLPKFYEELFDVLFYRHDQSKPGFRRRRFTTLDDSKVKKLFSALCFVVRAENRGALTGDSLRAFVTKAAGYCGETVDADKFRDELTKTVCLMVQDGIEYSFIHRSVTQYYAASFIRSSTEAFAKRFYDLVSRWRRGGIWDLELKFLAEIDTYRYMKWREIPLLLSAAEQIGYCFETKNVSAASKLSVHMCQKISLMARAEGGDESDPPSLGRFRFWAWSCNVDNDPLMEIAGPLWARSVLGAANTLDLRQKLLGDLSGRAIREGEAEVSLAKSTHGKVIADRLPNLGSNVLAEMQARFDRAMSIVAAEESKDRLLSDLVGSL